MVSVTLLLPVHTVHELTIKLVIENVRKEKELTKKKGEGPTVGNGGSKGEEPVMRLVKGGLK